MGVNSQTARLKSQVAENPEIYNIALATAGTEYTAPLNNATKKFLIRARNKSTLRVAFEAGGTTSEWITVNSGAVFYEENLSLSGVTIYIQANQNSEIAEILEWT